MSQFQSGKELKTLLEMSMAHNLILTEDLSYAHNYSSEALLRNAWVFVMTPDTKSVTPRQHIMNELRNHEIDSLLQFNSQGMKL